MKALRDPLEALPFRITDEMTRRDDDWRGEHLISAKPKDRDDESVCAYDGCENRIDARTNESGFCKTHYNRGRSRIYTRRV